MVGGTVAYYTCVLFTVCAYGGILLAAAAALVACIDCVRSIPLLIVHGLMWTDNVGFFFLAHLSVAPAVRFRFLVSVVVLRLLSILASLFPDGLLSLDCWLLWLVLRCVHCSFRTCMVLPCTRDQGE
jgi:hypothetical protein